MHSKRTFNLIMLRLSAIVCGLSVFVFVIMLFQSNEQQNSAQATNYNADMVITSVNNQRINNGLAPLVINDQLMIAAQNKANHMAENEYFSHIGYGKKWSDFIREAGYDYAEAGENLANGFDSVDDMTIAWMNSPSHRENIVNSGVAETGVGVAYGRLDGYPTIFVAQVFGRKLIRQQNVAPEVVSPEPIPAQNNPEPQPTQQPAPVPEPVPEEPQPTPKPRTIGELIEFPETVVGQ